MRPRCQSSSDNSFAAGVQAFDVATDLDDHAPETMIMK